MSEPPQSTARHPREGARAHAGDRRSLLERVREFLSPGPDSTDELIETLADAEERELIDPESRSQIELRKIRLLLDAGQIDRGNEVAKALADGDAKGNWQMLASVARSLVSGKDAARGDLDLAVRVAGLSVDISEGKQATALAALAQCQWAKGDKDKAIESQTKAVEVSEGRLKETLQKTLDGYKSDGK